jgi:predicted DNA-binding transcriptional regulator AlpA
LSAIVRLERPILVCSGAQDTGANQVPVARPEVTGRRINTASTPATITTDPLSLLSKQALAELLGVDPWTIDRWRRPDEPTFDPSFPSPLWISGATPRWKRTEVEAWLSTRQRGGLSPNWQAHPKPTHKNRKQQLRGGSNA